MTKACENTSGTSTTKGASVLFFGFHWSFAILEPSGNGWPLPGTPALYALIMAGLATIALSTSSVRAVETTDQSSYPLKSENAIPPGDISEYLSLFLLRLLLWRHRLHHKVRHGVFSLKEKSFLIPLVF